MRNSHIEIEESHGMTSTDALSIIAETDSGKVTIYNSDENISPNLPTEDITQNESKFTDSNNDAFNNVDNSEKLSNQQVSESDNGSRRNKPSRQSSKRHKSSANILQGLPGDNESTQVTHSRRASRVSQHSPHKSSRKASMVSTNSNRSTSQRRESRYSIDRKTANRGSIHDRRQSRLNSVKSGYNTNPRNSLIPDESQIDLLNGDDKCLKSKRPLIYMSPGLSRPYNKPAGEILISSFIILVGLSFFVVYFCTQTRVWLISGGVCTGVGILYLILGICWIFSTTKIEIPRNSRLNSDNMPSPLEVERISLNV